MSLAFLILLKMSQAIFPCTYETWDWNVNTKTSVNHRKVEKPDFKLDSSEIGDAKGCRVCSEDQVEIKLLGLAPIQVCAVYAETIKSALKKVIASGFPIRTLVGYRVGKSRGPVSSEGLRTQFSNHSYGIAIDINEEFNGLYSQCVKFDSNCILVRGGPYQPQSPFGISPDSLLVRTLSNIGFQWGGTIKGTQKDFMHFSLNGY